MINQRVAIVAGDVEALVAGEGPGVGAAELLDVEGEGLVRFLGHFDGREGGSYCVVEWDELREVDACVIHAG